MLRATIDFGIHLGCLHSRIAVWRGHDAEVIKNGEGFEGTPSAVWIDPAGRVSVGRTAQERAAVDPDNAKREFQRLMGREEALEFAASGRLLKPEEVSAEVLKELKRNAEEGKGETITAAVITVPADFSAAASEATSRAARLAGFTVCPLLEEPLAAAMAYGFQGVGAGARWLVCNLEGEAFAATVIRMHEGRAQVEHHRADPDTGGGKFDAAIVDELLVPAVRGRFAAPDFQRANALCRADFVQLQKRAREARLRLGDSPSAVIDLSDLIVGRARDGEPFDFELATEDLNRLAGPFITRFLQFCRELLHTVRLPAAGVEKIILMGEPSWLPRCRELLDAPSVGLGIPVEFRLDPATLVARGAAVFAANFPLVHPQPVKAGEWVVNWRHPSLGLESQPMVSGQLMSPELVDFSSLTLEVISRGRRPAWRSRPVPLAADGCFRLRIPAEPAGANYFVVKLTDAAGVRMDLQPEVWRYTLGDGNLARLPLPRTLGLAMADNSVLVLFPKGIRPPARFVHHVQAIREVRGGVPFGFLQVSSLLEGESPRADRNRTLGALEIAAADLPAGLPRGGQIEVAVELDESRNLRVRAVIPLLGQTLTVQIRKPAHAPTPAELEWRSTNEGRRLGELRAKVNIARHPGCLALLNTIDDERLEPALAARLAVLREHPRAADEFLDSLLELQLALDALETELAWCERVPQAERRLARAAQSITQESSAATRAQLHTLVREAREAIDLRDGPLLERRLAELEELARPTPEPAPGGESTCQLRLYYQPVGSERSPTIRGQIVAPGAVDLSAATIELVDSARRPVWRSPRIPLAADGGFAVQVEASIGDNTFEVECRDGRGLLQTVHPGRFAYRVG